MLQDLIQKIILIYFLYLTTFRTIMFFNLLTNPIFKTAVNIVLYKGNIILKV